MKNRIETLVAVVTDAYFQLDILEQTYDTLILDNDVVYSDFTGEILLIIDEPDFPDDDEPFCVGDCTECGYLADPDGGHCYCELFHEWMF